MAKSSHGDAKASDGKSNGALHAKSSILAKGKAVDPTLALLFASSAGPVQAPPITRYEQPPRIKSVISTLDDDSVSLNEDEAQGEDELSSIDGDIEGANVDDLASESDESEEEPNLDELIENTIIKPERHRKRKADNEDLEDRYMQQLVKEGEKEERERRAERRMKRQKLGQSGEENGLSIEHQEASEDEKMSDVEEVEESEWVPPSDVPQHESLALSKDVTELEKASRTVFLANVSTLAISSKSAKKTLLAHLASFFSAIPQASEGKSAHKVESIRFRSTAYAGTSLPKKAAFVKKELMPATTKSTNAYAVYSNAFAAREAVKRLNGTVILDRHLRVDGVAHPAKIDHRRCVFVGNLGFVDDESMLPQGDENERKRSKVPSDVEEGLWRQFGKAGKIESVRVVRDEKTRVGKGFAYVQFKDANSVEAALLFNEKKFPPMLPRILRVVRAKAVRKTVLASQASRPSLKINDPGSKDRIYNPKVSSQISSLQGRAGKLLGRAGAAQFKKREGSGANTITLGERGQGEKSRLGTRSKIEGIANSPETFVFEGFRASAKAGKPRDLKMRRAVGGKKTKPKTRSSRRGSEWKKSGGRKSGK